MLPQVLTFALNAGWPASSFAPLASTCSELRQAGLLHPRGLLTSAGSCGNRLHWAVDASLFKDRACSQLRALLDTSADEPAVSAVALGTALCQHAPGLPPPAAYAVLRLAASALELLCAVLPRGADGAPAEELSGVSDGDASTPLLALLSAQHQSEYWSSQRTLTPTALAACVRALGGAGAGAAGSVAMPWPLPRVYSFGEEEEEPERFEHVGGASLLHVALATPGVDASVLEALLALPGVAATLEIEAAPCGTPLAQCLASAAFGIAAYDAPAALMRAGARADARSVGAAPSALLAALWQRRRADEVASPRLLAAMLDAGFLLAGSGAVGDSVAERAASMTVLVALSGACASERRALISRCTAAAGGAAGLALALRRGFASTPWLAAGLEIAALAGDTRALAALEAVASAAGGGRLLSRAVVLHDYGDAPAAGGGQRGGERSLLVAAASRCHAETLAFLLGCCEVREGGNAAGGVAAAAIPGADRLQHALDIALLLALEAGVAYVESRNKARDAAHCVAMLLRAGADASTLRASGVAKLALWPRDDLRAVGVLRSIASALLPLHAAATPQPSGAAYAQAPGSQAWLLAAPLPPPSALEARLTSLVAALATAAIALGDTVTLSEIALHMAALPVIVPPASLLPREVVVLAALSSNAPAAALDAALSRCFLEAAPAPGAPPLHADVLRALAYAAPVYGRRATAYAAHFPGGDLPAVADCAGAMAAIRTLHSRGFTFDVGDGALLHGHQIILWHRADPLLVRLFAELGALASPELVNALDRMGVSPLARVREAEITARGYPDYTERLGDIDAMLVAAGGKVSPEPPATYAAAPPQPWLPQVRPNRAAAAVAPFPTTDEARDALVDAGEIPEQVHVSAVHFRARLAALELQWAPWRLPPAGLF